MLRSVLLLTLAGVTLSVAGQSDARVTGIVSNVQQQPLEYINVVLHAAADSSIARVTTSSADGSFELSADPGTYFLAYSFIGFQEFRSDVFGLASGDNFTAAPVILSEASVELATAEVVYTRPLVEVKADRTVFNVEGTANATGLTALELLRKAPAVMVDNNENITVKGKNGVMVYIDGKPSPLQGDALRDYLRSMQSTNIESIEIITNPSARFDAAGTAGIINIRLKKNRNFGTNGTVSLGYGIQKYGKYNSNLTINRRTEKWNLFGTYGYNQGEHWNWMEFYRIQNGQYYDQKSDNVWSNRNHTFKAGADYFLDRRNTIGIMINGNYGTDNLDGESRTSIGNNGTSQEERILNAETLDDGSRKNIHTNLNYHFSDTTGTDFLLDLDYGLYSITSEVYQPNRYSEPGESVVTEENNYRNFNTTDIRIASVKGDYERKLGKGKLTTGFKSSLVSTDNALDFYNVIEEVNLVDSNRTNQFDYTENINALYASYAIGIGKWSFQGGVRMENTNSEGDLIALTPQNDEQVKRSYTDLFPSMAITWNVHDKHALNLSYSRRIDRPNYQDLNPFEQRLDELSYRRGNAFLQPQYTDALEFTHTFMGMVNSSLSYSKTNGFFTEITDTIEFSRSYIQTRNLGYQDYYGFNVSSPIPLGKVYNAYLNFNLYHLFNSATFEDGKTVNVRMTSYNVYMQNNFIVRKDFSVEVSGFYNGPGVWGGTFRFKPQYGVDLAVKKSFWNDAATLRVALGDIFYTNRWKGISEFGGLTLRGGGGWESRQLRVNFSYNFGNRQLQVRQRRTGSEDLNRRVGN